MAETTGIEWTDATFNPWIGCTKVGPGCDHCYAETRMDTRLHTVKWGAGQERKRTSVHNWRGPVAWDKAHAAFFAEHGRRRRVFSASLSDWLDNEVPTAWLADFLDLVRATPNLDWLLLTKRIGRLRAALGDVVRFADANQRGDLRDWCIAWFTGTAPHNVWVGATIVNQEEADRDIHKLMGVPAIVRFLSMEPLLGPVDLTRVPHPNRPPGKDAFPGTLRVLSPNGMRGPGVQWVIVGGESGPGARPMHPAWARSLRDQCAKAGVPFLFKQWGEWAPDPDLKDARGIADWSAEASTVRIGKKAAGRELDGRTHTEYPVVAEPLP